MSTDSSADSIPRVPRDAALPLSANQEGRLAIEAIAGAAARPYVPYHMVGALRIEGQLDPAALAAALNHLVQRHEILRTGFVSTAVGTEQGLRGRFGFGQRIDPHATIPLVTHDLEHRTPAERHERTNALTHEAVLEPFDYARPPLMRAVLVRAHRAEHLLVLVMHHLVSDSWSMEIVRRDLFLLYRRLAAARTAALPSPPIQYADFAHWQQRWLQSHAAERSVRYWVQRWSELGAAMPKSAELPFSAPPVEGRAELKARETVALPPALSSRLKVYARERRVTTYMLAAAALQATLGCYTKRTAVGIMGHFANRTRAETSNVVGWFAHAHLLGAPCDPRLSLADLFAAVRADVLAAQANQEVPLGSVWTRLAAAPRPGARSARPADLYVSIDSTIRAADVYGELRVEPVIVGAPSTMPSLNVAISESAADLALTCAYSPGRFRGAGVRAMLQDVLRVISAIVYAPATTLAEVAERLHEAAHPAGARA